MYGSEEKQSTDNFIKDISRIANRLFTSEQKILIVMEALREELSIAEICSKYGAKTKSAYELAFYVIGFRVISTNYSL